MRRKIFIYLFGISLFLQSAIFNSLLAQGANLCSAQLVANSPEFVQRKQEACNTQYYATALDTLMAPPVSCQTREVAKQVLDAACTQTGINPNGAGSGAKDQPIPKCSALQLTSNGAWWAGKAIGCANRNLAINTFQGFPGSGCASREQAAAAINEACGDPPKPSNAPPAAAAVATRGPTMPPHCGEGEIYKPEIGCISTVKPKCNDTEIQVDQWCFPNDPVGFALKFYQYGIGGIGMLAVLFLILGGYTVLTSKGEPQRLNLGKKYIVYAVAGLLLAVFGLLFMETLLVDILKVPGAKH